MAPKALRYVFWLSLRFARLPQPVASYAGMIEYQKVKSDPVVSPDFGCDGQNRGITG